MNKLFIAAAAVVALTVPAAAGQSGYFDRSGYSDPGSAARAPVQQQSEPIDPGAPHTGPQIRKAQEALNDQGFNAGRADGVIGDQTKSAVRDFQEMSGIQPTGQLDPQTLAALGVSPSGEGGS